MEEVHDAGAVGSSVAEARLVQAEEKERHRHEDQVLVDRDEVLLRACPEDHPSQLVLERRHPEALGLQDC